VIVFIRMDYNSRGMAPKRITGIMNYYRLRVAAKLLAETVL